MTAHRCLVARDGDEQRRSVGELIDALDLALAVRRSVANDGRAPVVLQRASKDLGGRRALAIDEHRQRRRRQRVAAAQHDALHHRRLARQRRRLAGTPRNLQGANFVGPVIMVSRQPVAALTARLLQRQRCMNGAGWSSCCRQSTACRSKQALPDRVVCLCDTVAGCSPARRQWKARVQWTTAHVEDRHIVAVEPEARNVKAGTHEAAWVAAQVQDVPLRAFALWRRTKHTSSICLPKGGEVC